MAGKMKEMLLLELTKEELRQTIREEFKAAIVSNHTDVLIDGAEAAKRYGVKKSWIMSKARAGKIPSTKVGNYRRFDPRVLDEVLRR